MSSTESSLVSADFVAGQSSLALFALSVDHK